MPLAEAAAEEFNADQHEYVVSVTAGGTGAGILGIAERKYDIAMASRALTEAEKRDLEAISGSSRSDWMASALR